MDGKKCYDHDSDTQVIDKIVIRYKKDQWSPLNTDGKKCYDRDFLITLQSNPKCKKKPDNLPNVEIVLKDTRRARLDPRSYSLNRQSEVLMPAFHKSSSQRGPLPKRNSQQGKAGINGGKSNTIHVISLKEDAELRETETAWRPARLVTTQNITEDEVRTAELYKKVRDVLNKLTEEKFESLLNQVRALSIDNEEGLQGVIDLVFEKAVDEPNFSVAYALMCKELALIQVPATTTKSNKEEQQFVNFLKLLIAKCQIEFEKNSVDENARNLKLKEIDNCMDLEKKMDLQALLEEEDRRMRVKSIGNIRFIGELFTQQMITVKIMLRCINILLDNKDEDSLECLCKLLITIGKDLELTKNQSLQTYFNTMQEIIDKDGKISSRISPLNQISKARAVIEKIYYCNLCNLSSVVPLEKLRSCSDLLVSQGHAHKLIAPLLKQLVADNGPNYVVELWQSAGVQFTDFMSAGIVDSYVKENKFDFLLGGAGTPVNQGSQSWDQVHNRLLQFFKSNTTFDTVTDWIYANVGDRVKENQFIRTLVTAIVESAVYEYNVNSVMKLKSEILKQHYLLLQRFVDNQERLELQCLFALQALVHKWEHPPGLLLSILERFWEDGLLSNDSFLAWEKCTDPAEQEGKSVSLKSIQSLFTSLKEAEVESGSSTSDEA